MNLKNKNTLKFVQTKANGTPGTRGGSSTLQKINHTAKNNLRCVPKSHNEQQRLSNLEDLGKR